MEGFTMSSTFGKALQVTTFGESHGEALGAVIDGLPSRRQIDLGLIQKQMGRRRPGQSDLTTSRAEDDQIEILSGVEQGMTLGSPIALIIRNCNQRPKDYADIQKIYRPSHGDYTSFAKYGFTSASGGGRTSARETAARVAAGSLVEQVLKQEIPSFDVIAWVDSVKDITVPEDFIPTSRDEVDRSILRCPDLETSTKMEQLIRTAKAAGDSVGGTVRVVIHGLPAGLGEPVFDKLQADFAKALLSLPAAKGFEVGNGFQAAKLYGSENNDAFINEDNKVRTTSNRSGGIQAGLSNGMAILLKVAFKPPSTIFIPQQTVDKKGQNVEWQPAGGRHDPCVLPRAVAIVESMVTLVVMDHWLRSKRFSENS
jgi:chorismate synthase